MFAGFPFLRRIWLSPRCVSLLFVLCLWSSIGSSSGTGPDPTEEKALEHRAVDVRPTPAQVAWQKREITAFVHFGMNTFTDAECGSGTESPELFQPSDLDCRQWARVCRDFGAKTLILVAKHVDGFCLWPSRLTEHSVRRSPWRSGQGDVLRELSSACREVGIGLGIYLCPTDLHHPAYGRNHETYNEYFEGQLREVLSGYGRVEEVWFDGAVLPGPRQKYDWPRYYSLIRQLQPDCLIAIKGPDIRWCGNEFGVAREDEWSVIPLPVRPELHVWPDLTGRDLGSRERLRDAPFLHWYPAVANVSLRPGWFHHPSQERRQKTLTDLVDIYFSSVGRNAVLLLNVTPDRTGRIPDPDIRRLEAWTTWRTRTFATNLLAGAQVRVEPAIPDDPLHGPARITDGDAETWWHPPERPGPISLTFSSGTAVEFDVIQLQEAIHLGQRIESVAVEVPDRGTWKTIARCGAVGHMRLLRLPQPIRADELRVRLERFRVAPTLSHVGLYRTAPLMEPSADTP